VHRGYNTEVVVAEPHAHTEEPKGQAGPQTAAMPAWQPMPSLLYAVIAC
jgi:hypothetical protein